MKIFVTGTRGIPDIPGGVEKHCQELYPRIVSLGHDVVVASRGCYATRDVPQWQKVKLVKLPCPRRKSLEAIAHTFRALMEARKHAPDVVHIHAIGPSLLTPLARVMGFHVVVTNHGPDYDRQKWGPAARLALRLGERFGAVYSMECIAISEVIQKLVEKKYGRKPHLIHNGVSLPEPNQDTDELERRGINPAAYVLAVARFVPEKGLHDLIQAFQGVHGDYQLVIAGDADHETDYSRKLRAEASADQRIVLTGYITGRVLAQVFSHARLFVLPSYHEGLPIALLEAMSYGLPVLVSNIPANLEVGLPDSCYFRCGDVSDLAETMRQSLQAPAHQAMANPFREMIRHKYDWDRIARQTVQVYERALAKRT